MSNTRLAKLLGAAHDQPANWSNFIGMLLNPVRKKLYAAANKNVKFV